VQLPEELLQSLQGIEGFDRKAFEAIHKSTEQVTSIRINPSKLSDPSVLAFSADLGEAVPWCQYGYYLSKRPSFTFDPLFHAGCYYVQEASSMFLEQALKQTVDLSKPLKVLDLSAAPGGKSTHIQSLISSESLLVSNEVIRSRANILKDNMIKWGCDNVVVTNNDPKDFARLQNYFDVIVVDAPCSGSGLFRRDEAAIDEWSLNNVQLCSQRQQRILADVWPALKKNGVVIYSTCSYSREEDEEIVKWMNSKFNPETSGQNLKFKIPAEWNIVESSDCYRFWPDKVKGEGFFIACLRKLEGGPEINHKPKAKLELANKNEDEILANWLSEPRYHYIKIKNTVHAIPEVLFRELDLLLSHLGIIYSGIRVGELMRKKLIPDHPLAVSNSSSNAIERVELNYEEAILYLRKQELKNIAIKKNLGWKLVTYKDHPLGWINVLANRINNYYPKELRILKDI